MKRVIRKSKDRVEVNESVVRRNILHELKVIDRVGIDSVIEFLIDSDYFTAPASTMFHNKDVGGLAKHSLDVLTMMRYLNNLIENSLANKVWVNYRDRFGDDSLIIVGLFHDLCKVGVYKDNILVSGTQSKKKPYIIEDLFPIGHGEKSVIMLLQLGFELKENEMLGIRYHMNAFGEGGYKSQRNWNDLSVLCFLADYYSKTFMDSTKYKIVE